MKITLKHHTPLSICVDATRTCWDSFDKGVTYNNPTDNIVIADKELLERIIKRFKHESVSEHLNYSFFIEGTSRAVMQELARHRIASYSVKSSRYTLSQLKNDKNPEFDTYLVRTNIKEIDRNSYLALLNLQKALHSNSNDLGKYCMPESFKVNVSWTINARSLNNFLKLRTNPSALWEIRELAYNIYNSLPGQHKFLFNIYEEKENEN